MDNRQNSTRSPSPVLGSQSAKTLYLRPLKNEMSNVKLCVTKAMGELSRFQIKIRLLNSTEAQRDENKILELQYHLINFFELLSLLRTSDIGKIVYERMIEYAPVEYSARLPFMIVRDFFVHSIQSMPKGTSPDLPYHLLRNLADALSIFEGYKPGNPLEKRLDLVNHPDFDLYLTWHRSNNETTLEKLSSEFIVQLKKIDNYPEFFVENFEICYRKEHPVLLMHIAQAGELMYQMIELDRKYLLDEKLIIDGKPFSTQMFSPYMNIRIGVFHYEIFNPDNLTQIRVHARSLFLGSPSEKSPCFSVSPGI